MNLLFILLSAVAGIASAEQCCSYPIHHVISYPPVNVASSEFKCKEPIEMKCIKTPRIENSDTVAIAAFLPGASDEQFDIVSQGEFNISETLVCNPTTTYYHIEKSSSEYAKFVCAYRNFDGSWWLDI